MIYEDVNYRVQNVKNSRIKKKKVCFEKILKEEKIV